MWGSGYQKSEPARCCIEGPGPPSIKSEGSEGACTAKKKSDPWPAHAVPSVRVLRSKVAVIASRRAALLDFARSISCVAELLSAANADALKQILIKSSEDLHIGRLIYSAAEDLSLAVVNTRCK